MLSHHQTNGKNLITDQTTFDGSLCSTGSSASSSFCGSSSPEDLNSKRYRTAFSREQLHRLENGIFFYSFFDLFNLKFKFLFL